MTTTIELTRAHKCKQQLFHYMLKLHDAQSNTRRDAEGNLYSHEENAAAIPAIEETIEFWTKELQKAVREAQS